MCSSSLNLITIFITDSATMPCFHLEYDYCQKASAKRIPLPEGTTEAARLTGPGISIFSGK